MTTLLGSVAGADAAAGEAARAAGAAPDLGALAQPDSAKAIVITRYSVRMFRLPNQRKLSRKGSIQARARVRPAPVLALWDTRYFYEIQPRGLRTRDGARSMRVLGLRRAGLRPAKPPSLHALLRALGLPLNYGALHALPVQNDAVLLQRIGFDRNRRPLYLAPAAATAFARMTAAAMRDQVQLEPVSAFRSRRYQFDLVAAKRRRGQSVAQILAVSAAPGFSEHHTGRAIDLAAPGQPVLTEAFADTAQFAWLRRFAAHYGFRMSFPIGNRHGISYEPWHWCYVGIAAARKWSASCAYSA